MLESRIFGLWRWWRTVRRRIIVIAHLRQQFLELVANKIVMIRHRKERAGL
jgi:hypothetical protein